MMYHPSTLMTLIIVVAALLAAGAEVDKAKADGATALMIAAQHGHAAVVLALLAAGADVDKAKAEWFARRFAGGEGRTPLLVEGTVSKKDVLAYFSNRGESEIVAFPEDVHVENVFDV